MRERPWKDNLRMDPGRKYVRREPGIKLEKRDWPDRYLEKTPIWLSTDLRDGNQSLEDPMTVEEKWEFFKMLVDIGFKQIEVGFPSASQPDYDFVRFLVSKKDEYPEDVALQILAPCRPEFIARSVESLRGARNAIFHIYNGASPLFRSTIFNQDRRKTIELAVESTKLVRLLTKDSQDPEIQSTNWQFEYSPEDFTGSEPQFIIELCNAVHNVWEPSVEKPIIFNLPATVEYHYPTVYADLIEYFIKNIESKESIIVSLHNHNDRGCAVAAAELGLRAGAERVEGCLMGNGERTGNVDLITLALNFYTHGIDPGLNFSDLKRIRAKVEQFNKIATSVRHPYVGSLVFTAFSGSHQDAIRKGFVEREKSEKEIWNVPYLTIDPSDIGCDYEAVIRINSQSGKGGIAWLIRRHLNLDIPRELQIQLSKEIQKISEEKQREILSEEICSFFERKYCASDDNILKLKRYTCSENEEGVNFNGCITYNGRELNIYGTGNGPLSSLVEAINKELNIHMDISLYDQHVVGKTTTCESKAVCFVKVRNLSIKGSYTNSNLNGHANSPDSVEVIAAKRAKLEVTKVREGWGVGISSDVTKAGLTAVLISIGNYLNGN